MMDRHKHQTNHLSLSLFQRESIEHFWSVKCPEIWEHKGSVELNERAWTESKAEGLGDAKEMKWWRFEYGNNNNKNPLRSEIHKDLLLMDLD